MEKRDYYETLGVSRSVGPDELKKAYRKLAMGSHPDRNQDDPEAEHRFKELGEAYEVLKDEDKRAAYDRFGHAAFENGSGGRGGFDFSGNFADVFEDLFGDFMGGGRRPQSSAQRGADFRYNMEISLKDAYSGKEESISIPTSVGCDDCDGSGAERGTQPEVCPACSGGGKIRTQQGFFMVERVCPSCRGAGRIIANPCNTCDGAGRVQKQKSLSVKIPPGVDAGTRIRLSGEGEAGVRGGPAGDLYIFVTIEPHSLFQRDGGTIYCRVPIAMTTAILGGEIEVPAISGKRVKLKIPEATQTGTQFRLRQKGMPQLNSSLVGDMIVEARVETPSNLSKDQKKLVREFSESGKSDGEKSWSPETHGFIDKVKGIWDDLVD